MRNLNLGLLVCFRVATMPEAGGGHVSRCLVVAQSFRKLGCKCQFIIDTKNPSIIERLEAANYEVLVNDITQSGVNYDIVIMDSYYLDDNDISYWRSHSRFLVAFDDQDCLQNIVDLRIVPYQAAGKSYTGSSHTLSGIMYIPVHDEYATAQRSNKDGSLHCAVSFGLRDGCGATLIALDALNSLKSIHPNLRVSCFIGTGSPHLSAIKRKIASMSSFSELHINSSSLARTFSDVDIAIGAGGLGLYERMCMGLPNIVVTIADNQQSLASWADTRGGVRLLGAAKDVGLSNMIEAIEHLIATPDERQRLGKVAQELCDGRGADRISQAVMELFNSNVTKNLDF